MQKMDPREFGRRTVEARPCGHYDFSLYYGLPFVCACGGEHDFQPWMEIVGELPLFRFIVTCPERSHMTVLKARWNRDEGKRYLVSEMGTTLPGPVEPINRIEFQAGVLQAKTGRPWTRDETASLLESGEALAGLTDGGRGEAT
jgi:hypothetical protein